MVRIDKEIANELATTARQIATAGRGILAADESTGTIKKRFDNISVENTERNRAAYRALLFQSPNAGKYISGAILFEETLFQKTDHGENMVDLLKAQNIIPGIKVDKGLVTLPFTNDEKSTQGLDGLGKRCADYYAQGARFAKWRAVLQIDVAKCKPSNLSIQETAHTLARYAAICQENKLVPIVEPEILTDGDHTIEDCAVITEKVLAACFKALNDHDVFLEGCLLKPNMVTAGASCPVKPSAQQIADLTVRTLMRTVPPALPGIMFLSGGQSEEEATVNLNAMNLKKHPWVLSFSYGRALQATCLKAWGGKSENLKAGQDAFLVRAKANSEAQLGEYKSEGAGDAATQSLHEAKYLY